MTYMPADDFSSRLFGTIAMCNAMCPSPCSPLSPGHHLSSELVSKWLGSGFGSTGNPSACHACQPPMSARALGQPACLSSCATRALVASWGQAQ
jgi:Fe-S-cluster-containing dehydrogenase component